MFSQHSSLEDPPSFHNQFIFSTSYGLGSVLEIETENSSPTVVNRIVLVSLQSSSHGPRPCDVLSHGTCMPCLFQTFPSYLSFSCLFSLCCLLSACAVCGPQEGSESGKLCCLPLILGVETLLGPADRSNGQRKWRVITYTLATCDYLNLNKTGF